MSRLIGDLLWYLKRVCTRRTPLAESIFRARLPSVLDGACFQVKIKAVWPRECAEAGLRSRAERQLLQAAQAVARKYSVLDRDEVRAEIDLELRKSLDLMAANIRLADACVTELWSERADQDLAESQEALRRDTALTQAQQQHKLERLRFLGDEVLTDPALTRLWWLDGRLDKLTELVGMGRVFENAAALFTGPAQRPDTDIVAGLIQKFLQDLGPGHRAHLLDQLHFIFTNYEHADLADLLPSPLRPAEQGQDHLGMTGK